MARLEWDKTGERFYEMGLSKGVLYVNDPDRIGEAALYAKGVAWNGLVNVTESPSGAEVTDLYADNIKYASFRSAETYGATIECYTYPDEFNECDGSMSIGKGIRVRQQNRKQFGFSYRTEVGNDTMDTSDDSYKIHLIYGATASPSELSHDTINDSPEAGTLSYEIATTPVNVPGFKPTSVLEIDSSDVEPEILAKLEDILYGTDTEDPRLPLPEEIMNILQSDTITLGIQPEDPSTIVLGKQVSELQENIMISSKNVISGNLKYIDDFTQYSSLPSEQEGHFFAMTIDAPADAIVKYQLSSGPKGEIDITPDDRQIVNRIKSPDQTIKITTTVNGYTKSVVYYLGGLTLEPQ